MKKKVLIIFALIAVLGIGLFVLTGCGNSEENKTGSLDNETDQTTELEKNNIYDDDEVLQLYDTNQFDPTKFQNFYVNPDVNNNISTSIPATKDEIKKYMESKDTGRLQFLLNAQVFFTQDVLTERKQGKRNSTTNEEFATWIKSVIGNPSAIYRAVTSNEKDGRTLKTYHYLLAWDYGDFIITMSAEDFTFNEKDYKDSLENSGRQMTLRINETKDNTISSMQSFFETFENSDLKFELVSGKEIKLNGEPYVIKK